MVPDIAAKGHSFKGAFAYYLHDKAPEKAPHLDTAERVAWVETRNLASDDPAYAQSVMIATARSADRLKAEAGVKSTGRKSNAHVYAFSLAWHPDEAAGLDRAEMSRAVDQSLKVLGADHLQSVIVCHTDRAHPHVHVIVNRVDPLNGKMHTFSKDRDILSKWAHQYEQERGKIYTPARAKEEPKQEQKQTPAKAKEPTRGQMLRELADAQKARHGQEWKDLTATHAERREKIKAEAPRWKDIAARHREAERAGWSTFGKQQWAEKRAYLDREKRVMGKVKNAIDAVTNRQIRGDGSDRGFLTMAFTYTLSQQARRGAFEARQKAEKNIFARQSQQRLEVKINAAKEQQAAKYAAARQAFDKDRAALIERQNAERGKMREAWKQLYADRAKEQEQKAARGVKPWRGRAPSNDQATRERAATRPDQAPAAQPEKASMKWDFWKAGRLPDANKPPAPTPERKVAASVPSPAPAPAGGPPAPKKAQTVPDIDRMAEWAKSQQEKKVGQEATQRARDAWERATAKPTPTPKEVEPLRQAFMEKAVPPPPAPVSREAEAAQRARDAWERATAKPTPAPKEAEPLRQAFMEKAVPPPPAPVSREAEATQRARDAWERATGKSETPREIKPLPPRSPDRDRDL